MPKKSEKKQFFIKGKEVITDPTAPTVSDEFVDIREDGMYQGQTLEVRSDTHLEDDRGTGSAMFMRSYTFQTNPQLLHEIRTGKATMPSAQDIFASHMKGIAGMLWQDGLTPETGIEPRLIWAPDRSGYFIIVWARPQSGQVLIDTPKTLTEIINDNPRAHRDSVQRGVPVSSAKKKASSRATKAPK